MSNSKLNLTDFLNANKPNEIEISHHAIRRFRERIFNAGQISMTDNEIEKHLLALYDLANPISLNEFLYNGWRLIVRDKKMVTVIRRGK